MPSDFTTRKGGSMHKRTSGITNTSSSSPATSPVAAKKRITALNAGDSSTTHHESTSPHGSNGALAKNPWASRTNNSNSNQKPSLRTAVRWSLTSSYRGVFALLILLGTVFWTLTVGDTESSSLLLAPWKNDPLDQQSSTMMIPRQVKPESIETQNDKDSPAKSNHAWIFQHKDTNTTRSTKLAQRRPHFIFHIGPPKTATTTLQYAMTDYVDILPRDGYHYLGQTMKNPDNMWNHDHGPLLTILKDRNCLVQTYRWRVQKTTLGKQRDEPPPCWTRLREYLRQYHARKQSIIISEENFSIKYALLGDQRDAVDWIALAELLAELDFQPLILIGYRRLYDILPSAKQQWDRWTKTQLSLNTWPGDPHPARPTLPTAVGRELQPLFPDVLNDTRLYDNYMPQRIAGTIQWSYTDYLVKVIRPHIPVRLLNMHMANPQMSLRTYFLCHVLPYAPASCAQSTTDDRTDPETRYNKEESLFYDAIACGAAKHQWFNTTAYTRHEVGLALQDYYKKTHQGQDLQANVPLSCPPREQVDILLERSLDKEAKLWPPELAKAWRDEHVAGFEKAVEKHKFCWIDVDETLATQSHWKKWFTETLLHTLPIAPLPTKIRGQQSQLLQPTQQIRTPAPPTVHVPSESVDEEEDEDGSDGDGSDDDDDNGSDDDDEDDDDGER